MMRTKVVNDSTDLVPLLRAFDNKVKKEVFNELLLDWKPLSELMEKYGEDGEEFTGTLALYVDEHTAVLTESDNSSDATATCNKQKYAFYHLNPVTTLLYLYMDKHPEASYEASLSKVIEFFNLHESTEINTDLIYYEDDFNPSDFMTELDGIENFDSFMQQNGLIKFAIEAIA